MLQLLQYEKQVLYRGTNREGRNGVTLKRIIYLATAALVAMLVLMPAVLAQDMSPGDDDPHAPEQGVVEVGSHEELQQIAGQPIPSPHPGQHPGEVPTAPTQGLPSTGGPSVILPAAALLLVGSGILAYATLRRRSSSSG